MLLDENQVEVKQLTQQRPARRGLLALREQVIQVTWQLMGWGGCPFTQVPLPDAVRQYPAAILFLFGSFSL
jgi:hypothetical protein